MQRGERLIFLTVSGRDLALQLSLRLLRLSGQRSTFPIWKRDSWPHSSGSVCCGSWEPIRSQSHFSCTLSPPTSVAGRTEVDALGSENATPETPSSGEEKVPSNSSAETWSGSGAAVRYSSTPETSGQKSCRLSGNKTSDRSVPCLQGRSGPGAALSVHFFARRIVAFPENETSGRLVPCCRGRSGPGAALSVLFLAHNKNKKFLRFCTSLSDLFLSDIYGGLSSVKENKSNQIRLFG